MACLTCVVTINEQPVYGTVVLNAEALRLKVWEREWDTLGVAEGQTVTINAPDQPAARYRIADVVRVADTGNVWVHFVAPVEVRRDVTKVLPKVKLFRGR